MAKASNTQRSGDKARRRLVEWFRAEQRDLPWRRTRDPYAIWISEAMLQQTRVETVVSYWERFLARFPDIAALAAASEDDVLAAWSGLGYYRRARALRAAAQRIVEAHGGAFPRDIDAVRALPGVGPYTAGAVLSIAFDAPVALVDGNVVRVLARWLGCELEHAAASRWAWGEAERLVPSAGGAGEWNQALMELGASVCTPRAPACDRCPLREHCFAREHGRQAELPRAKPRATPIDVELECAWLERRGEVLLEQRPATGRMAGLWQLPTVQLAAGAEGVELFPARYVSEQIAPYGAPLLSQRHSITRHRIVANVRAARGQGLRASPPLAWVARERLAGLALTGMAKKALRSLVGSTSSDVRG